MEKNYSKTDLILAYSAGFCTVSAVISMVSLNNNVYTVCNLIGVVGSISTIKISRSKNALDLIYISGIVFGIAGIFRSLIG